MLGTFFVLNYSFFFLNCDIITTGDENGKS